MDVVTSRSAPYPFRIDATPSIRRASPANVLLDGGLKYYHSAFTYARPFAAYGVQDNTLVGFAANAPRWLDAPLGGYGLALEGQRTQLVPYCQTIGDGNWGTGVAAGKTLTVTSGRSDPFGGAAAVRLTSTGDTTRSIPTTSALASGTTYSLSIWAKSATGANQTFRLIAFNPTDQFSGDFIATSQWQRFIVPLTMVVNTVWVGITRGSANAAYDIDVYHYQAEPGGWATSPIITTSNTPVTRAADSATASLSALGIPASGRGTYIIDAVLGSGTQTYPVLLGLDDGSLNRVTLYTDGGNLAIQRMTAGTSLWSAGLPGATAGARRKAVIAIDGLGNARCCIAGGAVAGVSGGPTAGLTTLRLGNDASGAIPLNSLICGATYTPTVMSDAQMQALST